jgi:hypothetical protein
LQTLRREFHTEDRTEHRVHLLALLVARDAIALYTGLFVLRLGLRPSYERLVCPEIRKSPRARGATLQSQKVIVLSKRNVARGRYGGVLAAGAA